jgi:D-alanyl-D-alanine-carboxypeptidase/D-alanyl-D-alanine-endopeptidase
MTVMRAWAPPFWAGAAIGAVHSVVDLVAEPPAALAYVGPVLLAISAIPVLIGFGHRLVLASRRPEPTASDPRLSDVAALVGGRVRGAVAVVTDDGNAVSGAWGISGTDRDLDADSLFEIGSLTKTFTATLLADMAGRGEVALDDRVAEYLPGVPPTRAGEEMRLVDLATHSAGLPRVPRAIIPAAILQSPDPYRGFNEERLEEMARADRPRSGLGEVARYSNFGFALLGHVLSLAAGRPYAELIAERIFTPLGLTDSTVATLDEDDPRSARGHDQFGFAVGPWDLAAIAPAGGIISTVADMGRWLHAQLDPDPTPLAAAIRLAHEPRVALRLPALVRLLPSKVGDSRVGLAWITTAVNERRVIWHNGGTGGFSSFLGFDPERGRGVVVLTNSAHSHRVDDVGLRVAAGV